jgi:imidazolonepropionase-like amidohydrolase/Tol biopolymer transport system component
MRIALFTALLALLSIQTITAQDKKKWDVNDPTTLGGMPYKSIEFSTNEGTWTCLDVSPDGRTIVFDLLGDIYTMPIEGGVTTCIRSGLAWEVQPRFSPNGQQILFTSDAGGGDNIWLMQKDGSKPKQITKESFRLLNNAAWMPDGNYFVARKHFTSGRSLGAGEMWMYHISGGDGLQLTKKKNDQQDVNEPVVSSDGRYVYFSEDLYGGGFFQYNKNPNKQIFGIRRYDREEGKIEDITGGSGGACRPQLSPDGQWLAFVRRVEVKTVLFLHNLASGEEFPLYDALDKDQQEAWSIFGCYPGFDWAENGNIYISAGGKIKKLQFSLGETAVRSPDNSIKKSYSPSLTSATEVPYTCNVKTKVAETLRFENKVFEKQFTANAIRNAVTSPDGKTLIYNAAGQLFQKSLPNGKNSLLLKNLTALQGTYEPIFSKDGKQIAFVFWDDEIGGGIKTLDLNTNEVKNVTYEKGIYRTPAFSPDGKTIVFRRQESDDELGASYTKKTGIYRINTDGTDLKFVTENGENPIFSPDGTRIYVNTGGYLFGSLDKAYKSYNLNGFDEKTLFKSKYANQWSPSPDGKWLAFSELHKVYVCAMPMPGKEVEVSKDASGYPVAQLARDAGVSLHWSADSKNVHWTLGDEYFTSAINQRFAFLEGAPDSLPAIDTAGVHIGLKLESDAPKGTIIFENARIITMENEEVIENGVLVVTDNQIQFVGTKNQFDASKIKTSTAKRIDCTGKTIMPGIIDVHAHSGNFRFGLNPQKQWEYYANLAFGVTTSHDPSTNSEMVFSNAEMIKAGRLIGPRLFSTGTILYGAEGDFKAPVNSLEDARSALRRTKAWGAFSVKSYNQPRRDQRQQVVAAARELKMEVVPEGGSFFAHNMTQVVDGHTGVEHNIPVAPLYNDVITLWSKTKTHNTPTLIVNYGGLNGEYYWYQNTDVWKNAKLRTFVPRNVLDERSKHVTKAPDEEYQNGHILVSKSCTKLQNAGVNINLGAHGQLQGLGAHWELWMLQQGGMSNMQALKCATINGAIYIGLDKEIGSLKAGKLADLIVLEKNPLENIQNSNTVQYTMVNGRLYDSNTMNEVGNYDQKRSKFWFEKAGSQINGTTMGHSCHQTGCVCGH